MQCATVVRRGDNCPQTPEPIGPGVLHVRSAMTLQRINSTSSREELEQAMHDLRARQASTDNTHDREVLGEAIDQALRWWSEAGS